MLKYTLTHPEIIEALASAGHGSKVHITDGNYPGTTKLGENADLVYLNLRPGTPTVTEVLETILSAIPVEDVTVMVPDEGPEPGIFAEFRALLPNLELTKLDRFSYYDKASGPDTCLQIVTGEQRIYANILLTIGVVSPS